jgi:protease-4
MMSDPTPIADENPNWERKVLEKLALDGLAEQRRRRRWGIFFKLLGFAYLTLLLGAAFEWGGGKDKLAEGQKHTALVRLDGVIAPKSDASGENINGALQSAFEDKGTAGVVLLINSPGGSPVQSGIINDEIRRLRAKYPDIPLYAVVEDICASGGYYVAVAADKIYVDKASIVGSVGVLMDGFGFTGTMDKLGVERRVLTAGENKAFMDPFSPLNPAHKKFAQSMLNEIHQQFIAVVKQGRGKRLKDNPDLFTGLVWSGAQSVEMGLADGFGTVESVARDVVKADDVRDYTVKPNFAEKFAQKFGANMGTSMTQGLMESLSRFSLH